jgi:hypothetical protein
VMTEILKKHNPLPPKMNGNSLIDIKKKIMRLKSLRCTNFITKGRYSLFHIQNSIKKKKRKKKGFDII